MKIEKCKSIGDILCIYLRQKLKTLGILKVELNEKIWVEENLPITFEENIPIKNIIEEEKEEQYVEDNCVLYCSFLADILEYFNVAFETWMCLALVSTIKFAIIKSP